MIWETLSNGIFNIAATSEVWSKAMGNGGGEGGIIGEVGIGIDRVEISQGSFIKGGKKAMDLLSFTRL